MHKTGEVLGENAFFSETNGIFKLLTDSSHIAYIHVMTLIS